MKILSLLQQDGKDQNESNKYVLILRLLSIVMGVYFLVLLGLFISMQERILIGISIASIIGYAITFWMTYRNKSVIAYWIQNIHTLAWIICFILILGGDCGVQHFIFAMLVISCFATFEKVDMKIGYIVFLCALKMGIYFWCKQVPPYMELSEKMETAFQIINTLAIFACVGIISVIVSGHSQENERKLINYNKRLEKMAVMDELTGLLNRRGMTKYLNIALGQKKRENTNTIVMADIDLFKQFNDEYGHACGDVVLKELSKIFIEFMVGRGKAARWGGEEFLFLFENMNEKETKEAVEKLLHQVRTTRFSYNGLQLKATLTFGVEEHEEEDYEKTIKLADEKLYMGKQNGRNRVVC